MRNAAQCVPVVLAGGSGSRLWPLSSPEKPKQFVLKNAAGHSLFQATILRMANRAQFSAPIVVANINHRELIALQLAQLACVDAEIIFEPCARNTAAAIALAALHLPQTATMLVLPSDHIIDKPEALMDAVTLATRAARAGHIVTFAITPGNANTGYGYIEMGEQMSAMPRVRHVRRFTEKPNMATATAFLEAGGYGWNSGMFLMTATTAIAEMDAYAPEIMVACRAALHTATRIGDGVEADEMAFAKAPAQPFDRAVMERTTRAAVIEVDMGWRDMGSWEALAARAVKA